MPSKPLRLLLALITGFVALTAIGGGIALLSGAEGDRFPLAWLQGTPFKDYTVPGLLLAGIVGGSALAACVALFLKPKIGVLASLVAGLAIIGFVVVEVLILKQVPPGPTGIEIMYLVLGGVTLVLAGLLRLKRA